MRLTSSSRALALSVLLVVLPLACMSTIAVAFPQRVIAVPPHFVILETTLVNLTVDTALASAARSTLPPIQLPEQRSPVLPPSARLPPPASPSRAEGLKEVQRR